MTKFEFDGTPLDYPTLGFRVTVDGAILDGSTFTPPITTPPDARWSVYGGGSGESGITRTNSGSGTPSPAEPVDGYVLRYSDADNAYIATNPTDFIELPDVAAALNAVYTPAVVLTGTGIDLTGAVDCTTALRAKFTAGIAAGSTRFVGVPGATYKIAIPDSETLATFTDTTGVTVDMSNSTIDNSATSYTSDNFTPVFLLDGATDTTILVGDYLGFTLPTPTSHLGYRGATLVRAINGAAGVTVDARITNARYGVQTGEYGDATKGQCSGFDVKIRGSMIGYPLAAYYADGIRHDIDADGVHRAVYIAGCDDVRGVARWKDQYIADTAYMITDCLTSGTDAAAQAAPPANPTTSRGCTNVDVVSIDKGSTVFQQSSRCAGISLSRVDACEFRNVRVGVYSKGTDTVSTKVGGWMTVSEAKTVWSRYAFNWEPTIVLENVEVYGTIDHGTATLAGNSGSEFYVVTYESTVAHAATVRNFRVKGFTFLPSPGNLRVSHFVAPGLTGGATFENFNTPGVGLNLFTNATAATVFERSTLDEIQDTGVTNGCAIVLGAGTAVTKKAYITSLRTDSRGGQQGGAGPVIRTKETTLTLTGASTTWTAGIPAGSLVLGVQARVGTAIAGATGYLLGVAADTDRFGNRNDTASGSTIGPSAQAADQLSPLWYVSSTDIVATAKTSNFTAGTLRIVLTYLDFPALTAS